MNFAAPYIDYAGLSPIIALTAGIVVVLIAGVFRGHAGARAGLTLPTLAAAAGCAIWQWNERRTSSRARCGSTSSALAAVLIAMLRRGGRRPALARASPPPSAAGHGEFYALLLGSVLGMTILAQAAEPGQLLRRRSSCSRSRSTCSAPRRSGARARSSPGSSTW